MTKDEAKDILRGIVYTMRFDPVCRTFPAVAKRTIGVYKCTHEWYFDQYENGNYLVVDSENDNRIYCTECSSEWFRK